MSARRPSGSFWPHAQQRLLLQTALSSDEKSIEAWRELRPTFDLDGLEPSSYPLLPLVHRRLARLRPDEPLLPRLFGLRRRIWYLNGLLLGRLSDPLAALEESGAEPILHSSLELPARYYGDLGLRQVDALGMLVRPGRLDGALESLLARDWTLEEPAGEPARLRKGEAALVLHQRLFHDFCAPERELEPLDPWAAAVEVTLGALTARALGPADELLCVCLDGARARPWPTIAWIPDAMIVLDAAGPGLDWQRVVRQATRVRATLRLQDALAFLRDELDAPVPPEVLRELAAVVVRPRERLAHRAEGASWRLLAGPPDSLTRYLRVTAHRRLGAALLDLPDFLRDEWGLERRSRVPVAVGEKALARVRRARRPAEPLRASEVLPASPGGPEPVLGEPQAGDPLDRRG